MKDIIDTWIDSERAVYEYLGLQDYRWVPLENYRNYFWYTTKYTVFFADKEVDLENQNGECYEEEIKDNKIFKTEKYTTILVHTVTGDGERLFIFDNSKHREYTEDEDR